MSINFGDLVRAGLHFFQVQHDWDCPAIGTGRNCVCTPNLVPVDQEGFLAGQKATEDFLDKSRSAAAFNINRAQRRAMDKKNRRGGK